MNRWIAIILSLICYACGMAAILYLVAFLGDYPVPKTINSGNPTVSANVAFLVNSGLLLLFMCQHSLMARHWWKQLLTRVVPQALERSVYVLLTAICLFILFLFWIPMPWGIWHIEVHPIAYLIRGVSFFGWLGVVVSTFQIDHWELLGLRQAWEASSSPTQPRMKVPILYRFVRHPMMTSVLIAIWATPHMTWGHLLFSSWMTGYVLFGIRMEEIGLSQQFGSKYREYKAQTPMLIPGLRSWKNDTRKSGL